MPRDALSANDGFFFGGRQGRSAPTLNASEESAIIAELDAAQGSTFVANADDDALEPEIVASGIVYGPNNGERMEDTLGGLEIDYQAIVANRRRSNRPARHSRADDDGRTFVENIEQQIIAEMEPPQIDYAEEVARRRTR